MRALPPGDAPFETKGIYETNSMSLRTQKTFIRNFLLALETAGIVPRNRACVNVKQFSSLARSPALQGLSPYYADRAQRPTQPLS